MSSPRDMPDAPVARGALAELPRCTCSQERVAAVLVNDAQTKSSSRSIGYLIAEAHSGATLLNFPCSTAYEAA